jgi:predicted RNase H-like HicB family nuclease
MSKRNPELWAEAQRLASSGYTISISEDTLSNGAKVYLLEHPELPGCMAQGATLEEAHQELRQAAISYLYYLLEDGLEPPSPMSSQTITATQSVTSETTTNNDKAIRVTFKPWHSGTEESDSLLDDIIQPEHRKKTMQFSLIEGSLT